MSVQSTLKSRRLLDQIRDAIRLKHYSNSTEKTYVHWARRYILFLNKRHPAEMGVAEVYESLKDGFVDEGWDDTVLVTPGERLQLVMRFTDFSGLYLYHCHNLE